MPDLSGAWKVSVWLPKSLLASDLAAGQDDRVAPGTRGQVVGVGIGRPVAVGDAGGGAGREGLGVVGLERLADGVGAGQDGERVGAGRTRARGDGGQVDGGSGPGGAEEVDDPAVERIVAGVADAVAVDVVPLDAALGGVLEVAEVLAADLLPGAAEAVVDGDAVAPRAGGRVVRRGVDRGRAVDTGGREGLLPGRHGRRSAARRR